MNDNLISALAGWLDDDEVDYAVEMLESDRDDTDVWEYLNRALTKKAKCDILDRLGNRFPDLEDNLDTSVRYLDSYPPSIQADMEYDEYVETLPKDEQEWVKQAYHEMYANGSYGIDEEDRILQTAEMLKEARRTVNSRRDDAYTLCRNTGQLHYLEDQYETGEIDEDSYSWQDLFKFKGYETALNRIYDETEFEISNNLMTVRIILTRFYLKMESLRKMNNRDMKARREQK